MILDFPRVRHFILGMITGLALVGMLHALTIDSQLTLIKNDCYERLAIGQRLRPKDVYKTVEENTVKGCQMACTTEKELCKAFSFGVGPKGNSTCELSATAVKESEDLKPVGTTANTDFDLYIKKLGCSLVIEPNHNQNNNRPSSSSADETPRPIIIEDHSSHVHHDDNNNRPDSYDSHPQQNRPDVVHKPLENSYNNNHEEEHHVQTLVSISPGLHSVLHPVHEILIGEGPYMYGYPRPDYNNRPVNNNNNNGGYDNNPPFRPQHNYFRPEIDSRPDYDSRPSGSYHRPMNEYLYDDLDRYDPRPMRPHQRPPRPESGYADRPPRPERPHHNAHGSYLDRPGISHGSSPENSYERPPQRPLSQQKPEGSYDIRPQSSEDSYGNRPQRPQNHQKPEESYGNSSPIKPNHPDNPNNGNIGYEYERPSIHDSNKPSYGNDNNIKGTLTKPKDPHSKPIVTQSVGPDGEGITSIITEIKDACFRRVLAGKRVSRAFVKRSLICERIEDCQRECADEKRFACEGFNYRLDPTGRAKGECELLDIPLARLYLREDVYPDPDYDYYERDRNSAIVNCHQGWSGGGGNPWQEPGGGYDYNRPQDGHYNRRPMTRPPPPNNFYYPGDRRRPGRPDYDRPDPDWYDDGYDYDKRPSGNNRRGDFASSYHHSHHSQQSYEYSQSHFNQGPSHYLPPPPPINSNNHRPPLAPYDFKSYEPYLPPNRVIYKYYLDRERDRDYWGLKNHKFGPSYGENNWLMGDRADYDYDRKYLPPKIGGTKDWGQYGGSYGNGGYGNSWGFSDHKFEGGSNGVVLPPHRNSGGYLPEKPRYPPAGHYLPVPPPPPIKPPISNPGSYLPEPPPHHSGSYLPKPGYQDDVPNSILPAEPRFPPYNHMKDECSLRSAAGFRLHKGIVKKFYAVPSLYECEILCFKEKEFPCASYAYRYTVTLSSPTDNCYLSNRNYKELDFYTDLQPDRDFDIYTMNNQHRCEEPLVISRENSECFWRVRSAQRLHDVIVRDSLSVKSIVECQLECLKSNRFTCRAFSFRYGSPTIGGIIDNCQLTDWPYYELDPRNHFVPEPGFEVYDRGSYGHGCESNHFGIRGKPWQMEPAKADQLCYIGFGSPARLLAQAAKKVLSVNSELDCKSECSKHRKGTLFQCMSFSFVNEHRYGPNCFLSDILQRDLLPNIDYVPDQDSWLFAWDNYNPECVALAKGPLHPMYPIGGHHPSGPGPDSKWGYDPPTALDTWRVYSVSGWPCRRGSVCRENKEAGFWSCEIEGGDRNSWDYCCRPNHQCGYSEGFSYPWCYVGPARSQWRKCSDRYYPYYNNYINDRLDLPQTHYNDRLPFIDGPYNPHHSPKPVRDEWPPPGARPDRPPAPPTRPPPRPSLDEYETEFDNQFLDPPKPGGFGQPRHWPVSYLHKDKPPNFSNESSHEARMSSVSNPKYAAIQNLIDVIKSNDLKNLQYQITNDSNKEDDILFVRIPLPSNFSQETSNATTSVPIDSTTTNNKNSTSSLTTNKDSSNKRSQKSIPIDTDKSRPLPVYRRSYVTRTNVTRTRRDQFSAIIK